MVYFHLRFLCANDFLVYMRNFKEINTQKNDGIFSFYLWKCKPLIFQTLIIWSIRIHSLKYPSLQHWVAKTHFFRSKVLFKTTSLWFLGETRGTSGTRSRTIHQVLSYGKLEVPAWLIVQRTLTLPIICIFFLYLLSYFLLGYKF